ncbi:hypothetical protein ACFQL0_14635 [Haloplanus litoreus]|uniref:hypothetical protein n=1 Tax=Haloplanus litoreus TaxID=767515 RepID=UPI00361FB1AE
MATVDPAGTIQWERSLSEFELTQFMTVLQRSDGDFLVGGLVSPADVDSTGALVATLSRSGDVRWRWITDDFEEGRVLSAVERTDGDYLLAGSVSPSGGDAQLWLTTIGPTGERRWTRIYGGTGLDGG